MGIFVVVGKNIFTVHVTWPGVIHTQKKRRHARYDGPSIPVLLAIRECAQQVQ
uniref:Uncharacterized protein n=1 Tax=Heterorhabditis bacteriophora TaxID=37862 RepID=A0A1I7WQW1_HETBA